MSEHTNVAKELHEIHILGVGFGRTGTTSLKDALNELGFKTYHMTEIVQTFDGFDEWYNFIQLPVSKRENFNFDKIFEKDGYNAILDAPSSDAWQYVRNFYNNRKKSNLEISGKLGKTQQKYNKVKIILTVRDNPEIWYQSFLDSILPMQLAVNGWFTKYIFCPKTVQVMKTMLFRDLNDGDSKIGTIYSNDEKYIYNSKNNLKNEKSGIQYYDCINDKNGLIKCYNDRIDLIMKTIPKDELLVFNVKQGWKPLCQFLQLPIPIDEQSGKEKEFPRSNDKKEFLRAVRGVNMINYAANTIVGMIMLSAIGFVGFKLHSKVSATKHN